MSTGPEVFAISSDIGDTVVDEPTPQDVLDTFLSKIYARLRAINQLLQAEVEDDLLEPAQVFPEEDQSDTESEHTSQEEGGGLILNFARDREGDSNGEAEMEHQERNNTVEEPDDVLFVPHARVSTAGFASLDEVDLAEVFEVRACVMKSIPKFMRGAYRGAMKLSLQEIQRGSANNSTVETRGWKLFFLLPRLLLFKPPRGGLVPRSRLQERMSKFASGCVCSLESSLQGINASCRSRRRQRDTVASRVSRAIGLANLGELSNARQALEGDTVAPGNERTWKLLTDENKRPRSVREPLNRRIVSQDPSPCRWMSMVICWRRI